MLRYFTREWLSDHKIYFETIAALLVGVASVSLAFASNSVARQANRIASNQIQLTRAEKQPVLTFDLALGYDSIRKVYAYQQLAITNIGEPLSEFESDVAVFFRIDLGLRNGTQANRALVPVWDYYDTSFPSSHRVGRLASYINATVRRGNHDAALDLSRRFSDSMDSIAAYALVDVVQYVRVKYRDIFGEEHTRYYELPVLKGAVEIPADTGAVLFARWGEGFSKDTRVMLATATPRDVYAAFDRVRKLRAE